MAKLGNFTVRVIDYVFIALLSVIIFAAVFGFTESVSKGAFRYVVFIMSIIAIFLFFLFSEKTAQLLSLLKKSIENASAKKLGILIFILVLSTKILFVFLLGNDVDKHTDMHLYKSFATQLAHNHQITEYVVPALRYKYQVIYGLFLSPIVMIFGEDSRALTSFLSLLFAISTLLLYDIIRKYIGKNKAFLGLLLFNLLPVGLFETQLLVHETTLLFFYILSFWLLNKFLDIKTIIWKRVLSLIFSAILIGFGNKINQGGTIVIISYCIYLVIILSKEKLSFKSFSIIVSSILCYIVCFFVISNACITFVNNVVVVPAAEKESIEHLTENSLPFGWGLYLGTSTEKYGYYNLEDQNKYDKYKEFDNKEDAFNYQKNLINERLSVFKNNPTLIPGHIFKKFVGLWGHSFLPFSYELGNKVNDFVLRGVHGIIYKVIVVISNWVFILLCCVIFFSHKKHKRSTVESFFSPVSQFKMMIIGLTLVLFLFEVTPKYVSHMQIIMFSIGIFSVDNFTCNSKKVYKSIFNNKLLK